MLELGLTCFSDSSNTNGEHLQTERARASSFGSSWRPPPRKKAEKCGTNLGWVFGSQLLDDPLLHLHFRAARAAKKR